MAVDVGNPVVGVDVLEIEEVECIHAQPNVAEVLGEAGAVVTLFVVEKAVGHTYVDPLVGRCAKDVRLASAMWWSEGESVGIVGTQAHLPTVGIGKIVGEEEREVQSLVSGAG